MRGSSHDNTSNPNLDRFADNVCYGSSEIEEEKNTVHRITATLLQARMQ